ncbi:MAG TPA: TRAP transporter substrate-binding protein DctP [Patescibacteria group bacterium]|nr:TRAP transporter substrate-binding protein DctP [Patescibacteria group bacterium]
MLRKGFGFAVALAFAGMAQAATLKIATVAPEGTVWMKEMREAGANIKARTSARVDVKYFPGGVMGNDAAVLRKMKLGQLQGGALTAGELTPVYADAQIYSLPFLFTSLDEVAHVREGIDPLLREGFRKAGLEAVGLSGGGFAYLMSTRPIRTKEALRTTKVWTPQNDKIAQVAFEQARVPVISLPLGDVYTSLQTGLLETVGITTSGAIAFQWHTKVKHVVDLPLTYVVGVLALDVKAFNKLSAEDRKIVDEEFRQAFVDIDAAGVKDNESARAALVKLGIRFDAPSAEEQKFWRDIGVSTTNIMLAEQQISADLLAEIRKRQAAWRMRSDKPAP